jgi:hypothetical protein
MVDVPDPRALVTAAISIKRRVKEAGIRSSSALNWPTSEFTPNMVIAYRNEMMG